MATCSQKGCLKLLVFLLFITGSTQQVILQPFNHAHFKAGCLDGSVIEGRDQVLLYGSVMTAFPTPLFFDFFRKRTGDKYFTPVCTIDVGIEGCVTQSTALCYCQSQLGNKYTVVYNMTANVLDSNATLALSYDGSTSDQQLPIVRGAESVIVTIAGSSILLSGICNEQFNTGGIYDYEICGRNLMGAEFYIGTDADIGPWNAAVNNCSSFFSVALGTMASLTFAYRETQGCLRSGTIICSVSESPNF